MQMSACYGGSCTEGEPRDEAIFLHGVSHYSLSLLDMPNPPKEQMNNEQIITLNELQQHR